MSFKDLRTAREARSTASFVQTSKTDKAREKAERLTTPASGLESSTEQVVDIPQPVILPEGCYLALPPVVAVKKTRRRGRGLFATVNIPAGSVVISLKPHAYVLSKDSLGQLCTSCCDETKSTAAALRRCAKCKEVWYCSSACQKNDWSLHKHECEALQRWRNSAPAGRMDDLIAPEPVRCLARLLWRRKKLGLASSWVKELDGLLFHDDVKTDALVNTQVFMAHALIRYMGMSGPEDLESFGVHGAKHLVAMISQMTTNTFGLTNPDLTAIGSCVSPTAALINHNCENNVSILFPRGSSSKNELEEPCLQVIAFRDITAGSELFTTYIDTCSPVMKRQLELKETYAFTCDCALCVPVISQILPDLRERMHCPASCGSFCRTPRDEQDIVTCENCGSAIEVTDVMNLIHVANEELKKSKSSASSESSAVIERLGRTAALLNTRFPPTAYPYLDVLTVQSELLTDVAFSSEEASSGLVRDLLKVLKTLAAARLELLPFGHPVRGISLAKLGQVIAVVESTHEDARAHDVAANLKETVATLRQAYAELLLGFGTKNGGGRVGLDVREKLANCERELEVWQCGLDNIRRYG